MFPFTPYNTGLSGIVRLDLLVSKMCDVLHSGVAGLPAVTAFSTNMAGGGKSFKDEDNTCTMLVHLYCACLKFYARRIQTFLQNNFLQDVNR